LKINKNYNAFNELIFNACVNEVSKIGKCQSIFTDIFNVHDDLSITIDVDTEYIVILVGDQFYFDTPTDLNNMSKTETIIYDFLVSIPHIKKVILLHEHNPHILPINDILPNVFSVHICNIVDDKEGYTCIDPCIEKNMKSLKTTVSLNRNMRPHRVAMVSYLFGKKINKNSYISINIRDNMDQITPMDQISWDFINHQEFKKDIEQGFNDINYFELLPDQEVYNTIPNTRTVIDYKNSSNFDKRLRNIYKETFVELISETLYDTETGIVTEKFLNSVYGYNFPIIISTPFTVNYLRNIGFDMFDDIIDHSYDVIIDPCERMAQLIDMNIDILCNADIAKEKWISAKSRFDHNLNFAKNKMYTVYYDLALNMTKEIMKK